MKAMIKIWIPAALLLSSCSIFFSKNEKNIVAKSQEVKKRSVSKDLKFTTIEARSLASRSTVRSSQNLNVNRSPEVQRQTSSNLSLKSQKVQGRLVAQSQIEGASQKNFPARKNLIARGEDLSPSQIQIQGYPQLKRLKVQTAPLTVDKIATQELALDQQKKILSEMQSAYDRALAKDFVSLYEKFKATRNLDPSIAAQGHYLAGLFFYATKSYGSSIQSFNSMLEIKGLNNSNKVKALFGKAQTYKKMNIPEQSVELYQEIIEKYPSSHEASRAAVELQKIRSQF
jgi:TolA-binding protein